MLFSINCQPTSSEPKDCYRILASEDGTSFAVEADRKSRIYSPRSRGALAVAVSSHGAADIAIVIRMDGMNM